MLGNGGMRDADCFWIFAVELVRKRRTGSASGRALRDFPPAQRGGGLVAWWLGGLVAWWLGGLVCDLEWRPGAG